MKLNILNRFLVILLMSTGNNICAQNDSLKIDTNEQKAIKVRRFTHSVGFSVGRHYDILAEPRNSNNITNNDWGGNWTYKLFYELQYKKKVSLELGLAYLGNSTYNYTGNNGQYRFNLDIYRSRIFPSSFVNIKYYPIKKARGLFVAIGYNSISESLRSEGIITRIGNNKPSIGSSFLNVRSKYGVLTTGKEFRYKKLRVDLRINYYQHMGYETEFEYRKPYIEDFGRDVVIVKDFWYNSLQCCVTFIL